MSYAICPKCGGKTTAIGMIINKEKGEIIEHFKHMCVKCDLKESTKVV
jgi:hypothetical protein